MAFCSQNATTYEIKATFFVIPQVRWDSAFQAGASFRMGAESPNEFNEGFAPDIEDYGISFRAFPIFLYYSANQLNKSTLICN